MTTIDKILSDIRKSNETFKIGLGIAIRKVEALGGSHYFKSEEDAEICVLTLDCEEAFCFQPYPDIDRFYFEI
jgi:hypothetical protein